MALPAQAIGLTVLRVYPGKRTPRCRIASGFQAQLLFSDGALDTCDFLYHKSGANRDTWVNVEHSWLLKGQPHAPHSPTQQEGTAWAALSGLPLPTVHGFLVCSVQGVTCDFLLMAAVWPSTPEWRSYGATAAAFVEAMTAPSGCGRAAALGMCQTVELQLRQRRRTFLRRMRLQRTTPEHDGRPHTVPYDQTTGNKLGRLFRLVSQHLLESGYLTRGGQCTPTMVTDPAQFCGTHASRFVKLFEGERWDAMSLATRRSYLHAYLYRLWSLPVKRSRSGAHSGNFRISDAELERLCEEVMQVYHLQKHHVT